MSVCELVPVGEFWEQDEGDVMRLRGRNLTPMIWKIQPDILRGSVTPQSFTIDTRKGLHGATSRLTLGSDDYRVDIRDNQVTLIPNNPDEKLLGGKASLQGKKQYQLTVTVGGVELKTCWFFRVTTPSSSSSTPVRSPGSVSSALSSPSSLSARLHELSPATSPVSNPMVVSEGYETPKRNYSPLYSNSSPQSSSTSPKVYREVSTSPSLSSDTKTLEKINSSGTPLPEIKPSPSKILLLNSNEKGESEVKNVTSCYLEFQDNTFSLKKEFRDSDNNNRVVRLFPMTNFLHVAGSSINYGTMKKAGVAAKLKEFLSGEIEFEGKSYKFFAYSNSGLKSKSFWCVDSKEDINQILEEVGDFSDIKEIRKLAKRVGQSLGTTIPSITIETHERTEIEDITKGIEDMDQKTDTPKKFNYTDGVGVMTESKAREICQRLNLPSTTRVFQIRFVGYKGVMVAYPDNSTVIRKLRQRSTQKTHFFFRESMRKFKFKGKSHFLDVNNYGTVNGLPGSLNRHFIMGLCGLGVSHDVMLRSFEDRLQQYKEAIEDPKVALRVFLKEENIYDFELKHLRAAIKACENEDDFQDPYIQSMIRDLYTERVMKMALADDLKIPCRDSRYVIGVADETTSLSSGEICLNLPNQNLHGKRVLVTRNPAAHPGDFRVFTVNNSIEELSHIKGAVIFSVHTDKPPGPHCMGGGDLDGDLYLVCWDSSFVPPREVERGKYEVVKSPEDPRSKDISKDLITNFIKQIDSGVGLVEYSLRCLYEFSNGDIMRENYKKLAIEYALAIDGTQLATSGRSTQKPVWVSTQDERTQVNHLLDKERVLRRYCESKTYADKQCGRTSCNDGATIIAKMVNIACQTYVRINKSWLIDDPPRFISKDNEHYLSNQKMLNTHVDCAEETFRLWLKELHDALSTTGYGNHSEYLALHKQNLKKISKSYGQTPFERAVCRIKEKAIEYSMLILKDNGVDSSVLTQYHPMYHSVVLKFYRYCYEKSQREASPPDRMKLLKAPWFLFSDVLIFLKKRCSDKYMYPSII